MTRPGSIAMVVPLALAVFLAGAAAPTATPPARDAVPGAVVPAPAETTARAGDVRLVVSADRTSITIGDPIILTLRLTYPEKDRIEGFTPERDLDRLTLLGRSISPPRRLEDGRMEDARTLRITAYETGQLDIPSFSASFTDAAGQAGSLKSDPIPIEVRSILTAADTEQADIKPPATMPTPLRWPWVVLAIGAVAVLAFLWWRRRRTVQTAAPARPPEPSRPPHEVAYEELERLLSSGLLEAGRMKEFHIELSEILRRYLTGRFGVETFERTSGEILEALRDARVEVKTVLIISELFVACDLVKFARHRPEAEETRATVRRAYHLIDATKPSAPAAPAMTQGRAAAVVSGAGGAGA
jgi:hypothetical protein